MDVCNNFTLSLTGGFQECRNCGREKKFHKLDFENNTIEYVPKTTNNNAGMLFYYVKPSFSSKNFNRLHLKNKQRKMNLEQRHAINLNWH